MTDASDDSAKYTLSHGNIESLHLQRLLDDMQTMVAIYEADGTMIFINNTPLKAAGIDRSEVLGKKLWDTAWINYDPEIQAIIKEGFSKALSGENILRDIKVAMGDDFLWIEFSLHPVFNDNGEVIQLVGEGRDVSLRKAAEKKSEYQAHYDFLTNLPNRFLILDRLTQLLSDAKRNNELVAVMFIDLDDFKKINDTLGHETGDKLLIQASERLQRATRASDTIGRFGGDEFIVILGGLTDISAVYPIAENLLSIFRNLFKIDGRELMLTASLGTAIYPENGDSASELLRNADSAMYHSKESGRNTSSYFTQSMNVSVTRRLMLEEQLYGALDRDELKVFYQVIIDVASGNIRGTEALLRWHNPVLGMVSPDEFIPIAEQNGLIIAIGEFVLSEALSTNARWHNEFNTDFKISVNLSPRQFRDPGLVNFIQTTLEKFGVPAEKLDLEITEGVLISFHSHSEKIIAELDSMGVNLVMDDFGTGYSSLNYLRKYPFSTLKIDRSFIHDISHDQPSCELISTVMSMAHNLKLKVVAEGVETEDQLVYLAGLGCDYVQGFLYGNPICAEDLTALLASGKR